MTTRYAKVNFPLQLSSTSSHSDQLLPSDLDETFTPTRVIVDTGVALAANYGSGALYDLSTWTTIDAIQVTNTGTVDIEVDWSTPLTGGGSGTDTFTYVPAGRTVLIPSAYPDTTVFSTDCSVSVWCPDADDDGSANIIILGT